MRNSRTWFGLLQYCFDSATHRNESFLGIWLCTASNPPFFQTEPRNPTTYYIFKYKILIKTVVLETYRTHFLAHSNIRFCRSIVKKERSKEEKDRIGKWEPERMENGETLPQLLSRSKHIILKHWNK